MKLTGPYEPSPLTLTVCGFVPVPVASVVQVASLYSQNVIVPVASPPSVVGLIEPASALPVGPPVPGLCAVPVSVAVSVTGWPKSTGPAPAIVEIVGLTGLTRKHSPALESSEPIRPMSSSPANVARQQ